MKVLVAAFLLAFVATVSADCSCDNIKWAICDGDPCKCTVLVDNGAKQELDCSKLIPKCFLMKAEMYRARNNMSTRSIGGKPVETAVVDNDGIYDPQCENNGTFKAVQCNNTETCWCVNSAGVRRSDKADKQAIKCEPADTLWVRLELKHKPIDSAVDLANLKTGIQNVLSTRYSVPANYVKDVEYDKDSRMIVVDVKKDAGDTIDLPRMAYYMEKDIKALPLFKNPAQLQVKANNIDVPMEKILVYYVDDKPPTFTMKALTGGVIAVIVVVVLVVVIGLLVLFFLRRREMANYSKAQPREMETMS